MTMKIFLLFLAIAIILLVPTLLYSQFTLKNVEKKIAKDHPVGEITVDELHDKLQSADSSSYKVFDVREKDEFAVSRIPGARHVDPSISTEEFMKTHGAELKGKHLVFYCSVGKRSAMLTERLEEATKQAGAESASNLRGSIFRWFNTGYPVYSDSGEVTNVHPYDSKWGRLLEKRISADSASTDLKQSN